MSPRSIPRAFCLPLLLCLAVACTEQNEQGQEPSTRESKLAAAGAGGASAPQLVASVRRVGATVEVTVTSSTPFHVGAMPPILVIGDKAFGHGAPPPDGRLDSLTFTLDAAEFDALPENADVSVGYLHGGARLTPGRPPAAGLAANGGASAATSRGPAIRPDQVGPNRRSAGNLHKTLMEVRP
jgi:hypothetical protein